MKVSKTTTRKPLSTRIQSVLFRAMLVCATTSQLLSCQQPQGETRIDLRTKDNADDVELTYSISQSDTTGLALTEPDAPMSVVAAFGSTNCIQRPNEYELTKKSDFEFGLRVPRSCATSELIIKRIRLDIGGEILELRNDGVPVLGRTAQFSFDGRILAWEGLSQDVVASAQVKAARSNISATIQINQNKESLCTEPIIRQDEETGNVEISLKIAGAQGMMPGMGHLTSLPLPIEGDVVFRDASPNGNWTWDISALDVGQHIRNLTLRNNASGKQCEFAVTIVVEEEDSNSFGGVGSQSLRDTITDLLQRSTQNKQGTMHQNVSASTASLQLDDQTLGASLCVFPQATTYMYGQRNEACEHNLQTYVRNAFDLDLHIKTTYKRAGLVKAILNATNPDARESAQVLDQKKKITLEYNSSILSVIDSFDDLSSNQTFGTFHRNALQELIMSASILVEGPVTDLGDNYFQPNDFGVFISGGISSVGFTKLDTTVGSYCVLELDAGQTIIFDGWVWDSQTEPGEIKGSLECGLHETMRIVPATKVAPPLRISATPAN